jgi:putative transposase
MNARYNPDRHHRRSIRLQDYDYKSEGAYFITVCAQNHLRLFGEIASSEMCPNDAGRMVETIWSQLPAYYPGVDLDAFVLMPNHIHGIILLNADAITTASDAKSGELSGQSATTIPLSLSDIVHRFKSLTTARYRYGVTHQSWLPFPGTVWQRNYYEPVIRDYGELNPIGEYIANNPTYWAKDENNPLKGETV